jgi:carbonic anhydrase/acetyltransferase-like protein (isoleucine patch superfamily)
MRYSLDDIQPTVSPESWTAPDADIIGKVTLHKDASVWFHAVLRGDTEPIEIGEGSNVQDFCMLHTDPGYPLQVGRNVTIGHNVVLHGCTIGDDCLVGIGSVILNGAKIGANCLIGARSLITEGKEIPDGSVVMGAPAKVVREVTEQDRASMALNTLHYVERARAYRKGFAAAGD